MQPHKQIPLNIKNIIFQDVDIYLSTVLLFNSLLASSVLAINARTTVLWIVGAVFGFGMVGLYIFELLLSKKIIPENLSESICATEN